MGGTFNNSKVEDLMCGLNMTKVVPYFVLCILYAILHFCVEDNL